MKCLQGGRGSGGDRHAPLAPGSSLLALAGAIAWAGVAIAQSTPPRIIAPNLVPPAAADSRADAAARSPIVAPSKDRPQGACRREARDWLACIAATATLSDALVDAADQRAREAVRRRVKTNKILPQTFAKALDAVEGDWRGLRDKECEALAFFENGPPAPVYERRLACRIRLNLDRAAALDREFGDGG
jgi:uncharacterized protein YecT (DUF1311 family)